MPRNSDGQAARIVVTRQAEYCGVIMAHNAGDGGGYMIHDVVVKNKEPLVVPPLARRMAGFKSGQELEVKASGGIITIVPKLSPDELQDEREIRDPQIRAAIRKGHEEFLAGKTRPAEQLLAELKLIKPGNQPIPPRNEWGL